MTNLLKLLTLFLALTCCSDVLAADLSKPEKDICFQAMEDEMERSLNRLKLKDHGAPYFCQFNIYENDDYSVEASLGAVTSVTSATKRTFDPIIRVGNYKFDNSNFHSPPEYNQSDSSYEQLSTISESPIDDNYEAIRRTFWINTDYHYKEEVENLEKKKAYTLERKKVDEIDDFAKVKPLTFYKDLQYLHIDKELWQDRVKKLSNVFSKYPQIRNSWVRFDERIINTWLITSEGTKIRNSERAVRILSYANCQAKDGAVITDGRVFLAHNRKNLPSYEELESELKKLADNLIARSKAEQMKYYEGPVLFEGQAAAQLFARVMAPYLASYRKPLGLNYPSNPYDRFARRLGRRIMPLFLTVKDDPSAKFYKGKPLFGGFEVDDEGVKPEKLTLIEKGYLKTLCSGRTPTKYIKRSNGHGSLARVGIDEVSGKHSVLFVESNKKYKRKALLKKLKKLGKQADLDYVIVAKRLANNVRDGSLFESVDSQSSSYGSEEGQLTDPLEFYKLDIKSGKMQLMRGGRFAPVTLRILKDIVAAGYDQDAYPVEDLSNNYYHLISPSVLISEVEIERKENVSKPPVIPNPLESDD